MSNEQRALILASLKVDLGMNTTAYDARFNEIIDSSVASIIEMGAATLNPGDSKDAQLIIMYATWTWRHRESGEKMPDMLLKRLNNRILGEKARI